MEKYEVIGFLLNKGFQVTPDAVDYFVKMTNSNFSNLVKKIVGKKNVKNNTNFIIALEDIHDVVNSEVVQDNEMDVNDYNVIEGNYVISEQLEGVEGYHLLMKNRFSKYKKILYQRPDSRKVVKINFLSGITDLNEQKIAGLLKMKVKHEKSYEIVLEDESGELKLLVIDGINIRKIEGFLLDQMIICDVVFSKNIGCYIVKNCHSLDIPAEIFEVANTEPVYGVFLSDIHVGSKTFLVNEFQNFLDWVNGKSDDEEIVSKIKYLVIAGDVVDGIGVYPGQEEELTELNLVRQYDEFARLMSQVPMSIQIFVSPGNHDATRGALPQPPIFKKYANSLYEMPNVTMLGDPCFLCLHGVNILIYHGQSLPDIVGSSPGITFDKPAEAMKILLKARHLAPTHGNTKVALEEDDKLVIKDVPNIFHCGHVHTVQVLKYKGTLLINSGTWQSQTQYQKRLGIVPHPAIATIVNLTTLEVTMMKSFV